MRERSLRALCALAVVAGGACSTTPPPVGLKLVEPEAPPPAPEEVARAQQALRAADLYFGPIDGELSAETRVALARFQRRAGLEVTGTLDPATREALLKGAAAAPGVPEEEIPPPVELPSAEALLAPETPWPQPPPGWSAPLLEEVRAELAAAAEDAARHLAAEGAKGVAAAEERLARARSEGFARIVTARLEAGYAPLPPVLLEALRVILVERDLLLRPTQGGWGRSEEEAVRWLQRSLGFPPTGVPSLALLEALGIDPAPLFEQIAPIDGFPRRTAVQVGP